MNQTQNSDLPNSSLPSSSNDNLSHEQILENIKRAIHSEKSSEKSIIEIIDIPTPGMDFQNKPDNSDDDGINLNNFIQWSKLENDYIPTGQTIESIPNGHYKIIYSQNRGYFLRRYPLKLNDELLNLPIPESIKVMEDITSFWNKQNDFKKYNLVYKRGIMLYGPPGSGKSSILKLLIKDLIENRNGVVISISDFDDVQSFAEFMPVYFKQIEPDRPVIVVIEDIDNIVEDKRICSTLLNILDGIKQLNKVVYVATTNYPEKLEERFLNRPSRFDRRYYIGYPIDEVRRSYIQQTMHADDLANIDVEKWVEDTDELTLAHIRELIIQVVIYKNDYEESLTYLKDLKVLPTSTSDKKGLGF